MLIIELLLFAVEVGLGVRIIEEYHFILEFRRDAKYFEEYKRMTKKECFDIVEDADNCKF